MSKDARGLRHDFSRVAAVGLALGLLFACGDDSTSPSADGGDSGVTPEAAVDDDGGPEPDAMLDSSTDESVLDAGEGDANTVVEAGIDSAAGPVSTALLDEIWLQQAPPSCGDDGECQEPALCVEPTPSSAGICAPICTNDDDCAANELCFEGYEGGDQACFALVGDQEACGIPFVQLCDAGLTCFPLSAEGRSGACFAVCAPDLASSGCPIGMGCLGGWVDADGNALGICADAIGLGERCDESFGAQLRCAAGTVCAPDEDPLEHNDTPWRCRTDCGEARLCAIGSCRVFGRLDGRETRACY